jgi:hypothetical protein
MKEYAVSNRLVERRSEPRRQPHQYYSVEFSTNALDLTYQFKIWNMSSTSMCVLVREDSDILPCLKVGDTLNMKYYSTDSVYPSDYVQTAIRHITKDDQGRFKGHYLVGLEILESQN